MNLSYATMLSGVPGTGTREGGVSGLMLKVNLDGIVLMRFHHLCLRVCSLAALLYLVVALPIFKTAQCSNIGGDYDSQVCVEQNLTDYQRITLANIPPLDANTTQYETFGQVVRGFFEPIHDGVLARLYAIVFITWVVNLYAFTELSEEWRDVLALRRVYFLEADHWADRNAELAETLLREEENDKDDEERDGLTVQSGGNGESYSKNRDPWVPHPETRDTVPNVELYSVLVGGLPSLPTEVIVQEEVEAVFSRKQAIDWQLAVTAAFFDHCVPNQPGFSSSVAAVTVLPAATQITEAWNHWYNAAAKLRRLRFIRRQIAKLRPKEGKEDEDLNTAIESLNDVEQATPKRTSKRVKKRRRLTLKRSKTKRTSSTVYTESVEKERYYKEILGDTDDLNVETNLLHALKLGPEQTAVYSREFAQGAANLAPYGFNEQRVRRATLPQLLEMEKRAQHAVEEANHALRTVQDKIVDTSLDGDAMSNNELENMMLTVSRQSTSSENFADSTEGGTLETTDPTATFCPISDTFQSNEDPSQLPVRPYLLTSLTKNFDEVAGVVDKSISTVNQTVRHLGSLAQRRLSNDANGDNSRRVRRASISSTQLPDDLGLEAGLFLNQKRNSSIHSQHGDCKNPPQRAKSFEHSDQKLDRTLLPRRVKSPDNLDILPEVHEEEESDSSSVLREQQAESSNLGQNHSVVAPPSESMDEHGVASTVSTSTTESIWDRIARENSRRTALRDRISVMSKSSGNDEKQTTDNGYEAGAIGSPSLIEVSDGTITSSTRHVNFQSQARVEDDDVEVQSHPSRRRIMSSGNVSMSAINEAADDFSVDGKTFLDDDDLGLTHPNDFLGPSENVADENLRIAFDFEEKAGLRQRQSQAQKRLSKSTNEKWAKVVQVVKETSRKQSKGNGKGSISSGRWTMPKFQNVYESFLYSLEHIFKPVSAALQTSDLVDDLASESHYAVVTFTSRQAAAAARHCLADSRGADRWDVLHDMPSPPLADAPVFSASGVRGCVRPVTISINETQKMIRHYLALCMLGAIYFFYTIPLTNAQQLLSPATLGRVIDDLDVWLQNSFLQYVFTGLIPALVWTAFFAICPPMFKMIANFGSNATSSALAEESALQYFWWFMVVSAFTGTSLSSAVIDGFQSGLNLGSELQTVITASAAAIPTEVSGRWLNWMIVRLSMVLPTQYLLQLNTFIFTCLGLKCCARSVRGGGSGGPVPYRIYVDSGVVMLCLFALAPASPLISFAAFVYFLVCVPILRWTSIFLYRPRFDIGGKRFPFCVDMLVSGMLVGNMMLVAMMMRRRAFGPAFAAFIPIIPTIAYRLILRRRYMKAFNDVALLQTSLLDGWDTNEETNVTKREEFRQFLVDCHKAAYVPVCIASGEGTMITSEPAVVVPLEADVAEYDDDMTSVHGGASISMYSHTQGEHGGAASLVGGAGSVSGKAANTLYPSYQPQHQPGRMMRRTSGIIASPPSAMIPILQELKEKNSQKLQTPGLSDASLNDSWSRIGVPVGPLQKSPTFGSPSGRSGKSHIHKRTPSFDQQVIQFNSGSPQQKYFQASPTRQRHLFQVKEYPPTSVPSLNNV